MAPGPLSGDLPSPSPEPRARLAAAQVVAVSAALLAWLFLSDRAGLGLTSSRLSPLTGALLHALLTAALAMGLVGLALSFEPPGARLRSLGFVRMSLQRALVWGLGGAVICYAIDAVLVGLYLAIGAGVDALRHAPGPALLLAPVQGSVTDRELAARTAWMTRFAELPLVAIAPLALFAGVYEEVLFRGFLLPRLGSALSGTGLGPRARAALAVVLSSAVFAAGHGYQGRLGIAQTFATGAGLAVLALRAGSLWPCIIAHAAIDTFGLLVLHLLAPMLRNLAESAPK